ncbi:MAG: proline--tRNA ligase [archaeon]|jgi:prolyl-tRNA synthetase|nr:proline--tRNA ligase [Euryarchaeota archaeon]MDP7260398.1 proline--tRNA ligase [archaeon]|tara:strand:+ start:51287 stop:52732 length:1446 start_codon:yes stop_codon:yes gene_type:complete
MAEEQTAGITVKKDDDFGEWYNQLVLKAELADFTAIKGFMAIRPNGYNIWEKIQAYLDARFKETGHKNSYFPALIPESFLTKEAQHIEGFAPEAFWISHEGENEVEERLALRPTSETIMYDSYSKWIKSWRELPLLLNVWCSVFRYETKMTKLFLRTREFLWQEGHTVHATREDADIEVRQQLDTYKDLCESLLAIPVIQGVKTDRERFAGALTTTTIEGLMPDGKALQMGTSHNLGQNFSKAFKIKFIDKDEKKKFAWQTSWGVSTRLIGALIMVHGDDKGLVLPPKIAETKAVVVPILFEDSKKKVLDASRKIAEKLSKDIVVHFDDRENYSAGWKFNEWELVGVPLRIEIGPKDVEKKQAVVVRRDTGKKTFVKISELNKFASDELEKMQKDMLSSARKFLKDNTHEVKSYTEFKKVMDSSRGFIIAQWCGSEDCEIRIQEETTATVRCIPFNKGNGSGKCVLCAKKSQYRAYFAKSY